LDAPFGVQRVVRRLLRTSSPRHTTHAEPRSLGERAVRRVRAVAATAHLFPAHGRVADAPHDATPGTMLATRIGHERVVALTVAAIVAAASALNAAGPTPIAVGASIGGPEADAPAPRLAIGGGLGIEPPGIVYGAAPRATVNDPLRTSHLPAHGFIAVDLQSLPGEDVASVAGPFLEDGTLLKPVFVDTTVADGRELLRTHTVAKGETLSAVAKRYDVKVATIWWANGLKSRTLEKGQVLTIPPVDGLVVTIDTDDTLASVARKHKVEASAILAANDLTDPNLVVGQVLILPGATGKPLPTPKPVSKPKPKSRVVSGGPTRYNGGSFAWPVPGGKISQYYKYGHYGIDIAADHGTSVRAAAGGKVIFAGWKSNGGGYQVWISHGSNLYTTYNHMSSIAVGTGQSVGRGQQVGRVGSSGYATGPHLHFEVWKGRIWDGGRRVNPLGYL
jgi:murein DD-endopeptidase MepM/ murein hydrolase activator NlpD